MHVDHSAHILECHIPFHATLVQISLEVYIVKHPLLFLEKKRETLQELLAALLDDTKETSSPISQVPQLRDDSLLTDFEQAFDLATANDCIEAALNNM